ncbi:hypothetical protein N7481_006200 [Penicillium waksmanii]|uniref:uncharacterized protein n=1 Tax=Penicillium waksmanii TaxID=69791 RepID=UPI002548527A|nr:uncharacterized protein N7481_006200 [Penicillium waksmanii]KAJ5984101.1 hypothetical protein N7481_006200 [Penicillium waksmanii]
MEFVALESNPKLYIVDYPPPFWDLCRHAKQHLLPVKRPGLARRAVSSHAVVTRANTTSDLSESHTNKALLHPVHHKSHRAHVVGGHRNHHRNPSLGKNLSKLKLFQLAPEATARNHHRKKSAPATPVGSPKDKGHVRWDGALEDHPKNSMKRNNSTPVLRHNNFGGTVSKKALVADRPLLSAGKKKSVGFELGDDLNDDAEWEDTTQSPESTRRNSVAPSNPSLENNNQVLVDPLTFVKRPYPQISRATSLPESITNKFVRDQSDPDEEDEDEDEDADEREDDSQELDQSADQGDIANRLLSPTHSAKAPPAMSSISAMAKPSTKDPASRSASVNLAQDKTRRTFSTSNPGLAMTPGSQPHATSSSMEGGVSRFIVSNKTANQASSRTDSDPNTPSSFLPHYHPQTPPSPNRGAAKAAASPARPLATSSTAMDMAANQVRPGTVTFDVSRGINGGARTGAIGHDNESRQTRKAYEKVALELTAVRRFQSPTGDSFNRLRSIARASKASALGKPIKSAPSLPLLQTGKRPSRLGSSSESKSQLRDPQSSTSEDPATQSESTDAMQAAKSFHPSHRILSTSDEAVHGLTGEQDTEDYPRVNQTDMMIRRMWESREVATSG